ncbi:MAG TPA: sugar phosphate nucleotidyltransferase, partial [Anaerolineaceae bacterium]|nr:sugar phosphate nucleotidyltransferase [Anaerolineaceae bacterium]
VLDYVLNQFQSLTNPKEVEYIFIVGPNQGELIQAHMHQFHPEKVVHYVVQERMRGQSDALYLAREYLTGPILMTFSDTLIETDLSFLAQAQEDAIAWVKPVDDPSRFGVAHLNKDNFVTFLKEKPKDKASNLAVVGFYYFRSGEALMAAIEEQIQRNISLKDEFFLADAINILLEHGAKMTARSVETWLDAGLPDALLETNRYLLDHGHDNSAQAASLYPNASIIPPVFIHPSAKVVASVVGPHVSVGEEVDLHSVVVQNSILEEGAQVQNMVLENSLLGRNVILHGQVLRLNLGDQSWAMS